MFAWTGFPRLADHVVRQVGDAAAERAAISRAYYVASRAGSTHRDVWERVRRRGDPTSRAIHQAGNRLHGWRKNTGHDNPFPVADISFQARHAVSVARQILDDLTRPV